MGRGGAPYISYTGLVLYGLASSASATIWEVDILHGPAPPPEEGPPLSANASRDRSLLPYQIIGILCSYIGSLLIVGSLYLTVGRRMRKRAQDTTPKPAEMVKPMPKTFDPSPISPGSRRSWYSPRRLHGKKSTASSIRSGKSNQLSPGMDSVVSFDNNVIQSDRAQRAMEMERLYAAVMARDDQEKTQPNLATDGVEEGLQGGPRKKAPPRLITDDPSLRHLQAGASAPNSPRDFYGQKSPVRAIYPPHSPMPPGPSSPTSPLKAEYQEYQNGPLSPNYIPPPQREDANRDQLSRASSIASGQSGGPSARRKIRKSLRNIKISSPMPKNDNDDGARTPLSPRFYTDPGLPPEPPTAGTTGTADSLNYPPTTPGTANSYRWGDDRDAAFEQLDEIRALPPANPQRVYAYQYDNEPQAVTDHASTRPDPTVPTLRAPKIATGTGTLPLREMNKQYATQQQQHDHQPPQQRQHPNAPPPFPLSPSTWNPSSANQTHPAGYATSAGPVKTTFLESRRDRLGAPRTGLATPYSPYMPYTPLTPVTPRLATRRERREREREERAVLGALGEEDAVMGESEMWGDAY